MSKGFLPAVRRGLARDAPLALARCFSQLSVYNDHRIERSEGAGLPFGIKTMLGEAERGDAKSDDTGCGTPRARQDRRIWLDRRGANAVPMSATGQARAYNFRDLRERRNRQDRRLYRTGAQADTGEFVGIMREDILTVLSIFMLDR